MNCNSCCDFRARWLVLLALVAGCTTQSSAPQVEHAELGRQFLLAEEPGGAVGILDYREAAGASDEPAAAEVALLGRIGGGNPTWSSQSASFLLSDPSHEIAADHVCTSDNCPFCKGKQGEDKLQAIVMLTGRDDRVPAYDARKLLPLAEGQMVVVRGRAEINGAGQLIVHARGLYVRR
jgi:hypothetical protein